MNPLRCGVAAAVVGVAFVLGGCATRSASGPQDKLAPPDRTYVETQSKAAFYRAQGMDKDTAYALAAADMAPARLAEQRAQQDRDQQKQFEQRLSRTVGPPGSN